MDTGAPIDKLDALSRLGNDEELYNEVLSVFVEDCPEQIALLSAAINSHTLSEVLRISHSIKSASANVGANLLSHAALELEKSAREKNEAVFKDQAAKIVACWNEVKEYLSREP